MDISPLTTIRCLILGHRFETHLVRCNGSHFIAASAVHIWRPVSPNDGDVIREFREGANQ
jgi:hypothetical protein